MLTRCPACNTRFRLHPAQLQAAGGQVRCGRCQQLFDARPPGVTAELPATATARTSGPAITPRRPRGNHKSNHRLLWLLGVLLMSAALGLQYVWWERQRLVAHPMGQRILQQICRHVACDVQPPRSPEQIEVLERSLTPHPDRQQALLFKLRLANRAAHAQPFPVIELQLFDSRQGLTAARRFGPEQYRPKNLQGWDLMHAGETVEVHLELQDPGTHITGFLLDFL